MIVSPDPFPDPPLIALATFPCWAAFRTTSPAVSIAGMLSSPPGPCTIHPWAYLASWIVGTIPICHTGLTLFDAAISRLIPSMAVFRNHSIIEMMLLKIDFAAAATVLNIPENASANDFEPSPENHPVRSFHIWMAASLNVVHFVTKVVFTVSHSVQRNDPNAVNTIVAAAFKESHMTFPVDRIAFQELLHAVDIVLRNQSQSPVKS